MIPIDTLIFCGTYLVKKNWIIVKSIQHSFTELHPRNFVQFLYQMYIKKKTFLFFQIVMNSCLTMSFFRRLIDKEMLFYSCPDTAGRLLFGSYRISPFSSDFFIILETVWWAMGVLPSYLVLNISMPFRMFVFYKDVNVKKKVFSK